MFRSKQYRAEAAEYGERAKCSRCPDQGHQLEEMRDRLLWLADNEEALANDYREAVHFQQPDRTGDALANEEELVLRCLGAAVILQWRTLSTSMQRELFDTAGSVGQLLDTAELRGQIARFLHKHKDDAHRATLG